MISSIYGKVFGKTQSTQNSYILNPVPIQISKGPGPQISSEQIEATEDAILLSESNQTLKMKIGETAKLQFQENITTGYTWILLKHELEYHGLQDSVKVVTSDYIKPKMDVLTYKPLVGVPGTRIIGLEALKSVEMGVLHFVLCRPWELEQKIQRGEIYEPIQSMKININVQ